MEELRYPGREVYKNAPVALVVAELRISYDPQIKDFNLEDGFAALIRPNFPILSEEIIPKILPLPGLTPVSDETVRQIRASNEAGTQSICVNSNAILFECSKYTRFEDFSELMRIGLTALEKVIPNVWIKRLGLRYIDEIHMPGVEGDVRNWNEWINPQLLGSLNSLPDNAGVGVSGTTVFNMGGNSAVIFKWGSYFGHTILKQTKLFHESNPDPEHTFILDLDSYTELLKQNKFDVDWILSEFETLHKPAGQVFNWAINDGARLKFREEAS